MLEFYANYTAGIINNGGAFCYLIGQFVQIYKIKAHQRTVHRTALDVFCI